MLPLANLFLIQILSEMPFYKEMNAACLDLSQSKCKIRIKNIPFDTIEYQLDQKYFNKSQEKHYVKYSFLSLFLDELRLYKDGTIEYNLIIDDIKDDIITQIVKGFAKVHLYVDIDHPPVISKDGDSFTFKIHGDIDEFIINSTYLYFDGQKDLINTYLNNGAVTIVHGGLKYIITSEGKDKASVKVTF